MNIPKILAAFLVVLIVVLGSSYTGVYFYASKARHVIEYSTTKPQYVTDRTFKTITTAKPGDGVLYNLDIVRFPLDCFADFVSTMTTLTPAGRTVSYQLPIRRTSQLTAKITNLQLAVLITLPVDLPDGHYHIRQLVYPTCSSITLLPFDPGMDVQLDVKK